MTFAMQKQLCMKKRKKKPPNKFKMNNLYDSDLHYSTIQQNGKEVWFWGSGCVLLMYLRSIYTSTL